MKNPEKTDITLGRPAKVAALLGKLKGNGLFRVADAERVGISQPSLSRLVSAGQVHRVGRGLYELAAKGVDPDKRDYVVACTKFGNDAFIGGLTALFHYGLTEQVPGQVWVIVSFDTKTVEPLYRLIRTRSNTRKGVLEFKDYRIASIERAVLEGLRYSSKIGLGTALRAARKALSSRKTTETKLYNMAKELKLERVLQKHWESILPEV